MTTSVEALDTAYRDLSRLFGSLTEAESWRPTRCPGWVVRDLVLHLLEDAQRALVALATPVDAHPDRDAVSYWVDAPGAADPESRGVRALRSMASQCGLGYLTSTYAETTAAVCTLARRTPGQAAVATQNHVLRVDDLLATLVVEAAVHHLDAVVELDRPGPAAAPLAVVRRTLDGLLGRTVPGEWPDADWALVATGRTPPTAEHRSALGADITRLPLLG